LQQRLRFDRLTIPSEVRGTELGVQKDRSRLLVPLPRLASGDAGARKKKRGQGTGEDKSKGEPQAISSVHAFEIATAFQASQ